MKLRKLTASLHEMPVTLPDVNRPLELRQFMFCEIETEEGVTGSGITGQFLPWAVIAALEHHIFPSWKGSTCAARSSSMTASGRSSTSAPTQA